MFHEKRQPDSVEMGSLSRPYSLKGCQFKILWYAFKVAQLIVFESKNSFDLSTQKQG